MSANRHLTKGSPLPPVKEDLLRLYGMRFCPFFERTKLVLEHKEIPHETVYVHLKQKPDWLLERNPAGTVPTIEYRGRSIYESAICNEFLEEAFPSPETDAHSLLSSNPFERAAARLLIVGFDKALTPYYGLLFLDAEDGQKRQELVEKLHALLLPFESHLANAKTPYFGGSKCGIVDLHMWPFFERFPAISELTRGELLPSEKFPSLNAWTVAMGTVEAVKKVRLPTDLHKKFLVTYKAGDPQYDLAFTS